MSNTNEDVIIEAGLTLTDKQRKDINEGVQWVKDWYQKRHDADLFLDGKDIGIDINEYETSQKKLNNLKIVATEDMYGTLSQMILDGKLHLKDEIIAQVGGNEKEAIASMILVNQRKSEDPIYAKAAGLSFKYIKEPVLFLNVPLLDKESQNIDAPSLSSTVAHEVTHTLGLQLNESMIGEILENGALKEGVVPDAYLDNPKEVYARLKELCKNRNIDPTKEVTIEKIKKIREECEKKRADYEKKGGTAPKDLDHHLFDRYTDEGLSEMINYTAMSDDKPSSDYDTFRNEAKADLALSRYKISNAEKLENNTHDEPDKKTSPVQSNEVIQKMIHDTHQYS